MQLKKEIKSSKEWLLLSVMVVLLAVLAPALRALECYTQGPPGMPSWGCNGHGGFTGQRWAVLPGNCTKEGNCSVIWKFKCRDGSVQTSSSHMPDPICTGGGGGNSWWPYWPWPIHAI